MNWYALASGTLVAIYILMRFRQTKLEHKQWVYPLFLATFPLYYWLFALYGSDATALRSELIVGILFMTLAFAAYKLNRPASLLVLATGYIGHAVYDAGHNALFINSGTPAWWPAFCGSIDVLMGSYLLFMAIKMTAEQHTE